MSITPFSGFHELKFPVTSPAYGPTQWRLDEAPDLGIRKTYWACIAQPSPPFPIRSHTAQEQCAFCCSSTLFQRDGSLMWKRLCLYLKIKVNYFWT